MSEARPLARRVVVVGGGQVALLAAIGLKRSVPGCEVTVLAAAVDPADIADNVVTALPFTNRLHDRFGISEETMVVQAGASHRLVTRYSDWGRPSASGTAAYGAALPQQLRTAFARYWGGAAPRGEGAKAPLTLSEALAREGRFAPPPDDQAGPFSELDYALRWQRERYNALLAGIARGLGIVLRGGAIADVSFDDEGVAEVVLDDGSRLDADLYLDCSGTARRLFSHLCTGRRIDWSARLPVRRLAVARGNRPQLRLDDRIGLTRAGWVAETAGTDGQEAVLGLPPGGDDALARALFRSDAIAFTAIEQGRLEAAWIGNVVAIGDAAVQVEPLGWTNLDIAHRMIDLLLELLPGSRVHPLERAEFNRRYAMIAERACDFVSCHYAAPAAPRFYGRPRRSPLCEVMLDQFVRRGKLPFVEEPPLAGREWHGVLKALGIPAGIDVVTGAEPAAAHEAMLAAHYRALAEAVRQAPPYAEWYRSVTEPA